MQSTILRNEVLSKCAEQYLQNNEKELLGALARAAAGGAPLYVESVYHNEDGKLAYSSYQVPIRADCDVLILITNGTITLNSLRDSFVITPDIAEWLNTLAYDFGLNVEAVGNVIEDNGTRTLVLSKFEGGDVKYLDRLGVKYKPCMKTYRAARPADIRGTPLHVIFQSNNHERKISFKMFERLCLE